MERAGRGGDVCGGLCVDCNGVLTDVHKQQVEDRKPEQRTNMMIIAIVVVKAVVTVPSISEASWSWR